MSQILPVNLKSLMLILLLLLTGSLLTTAAQQTNKHKKIYVVSHGWHTGFVVPAGTIQNQLPQLRERFADTPFIEFGWGDYDFYQENEMTPGFTFKALFWPTESVIHAVAVPQQVEDYFYHSRVETLCLNEPAYLSLIRYITDSFYKNEQGKLLQLKSGLYGDSQFYKGTGTFHLMSTCNQWTARGLQHAGMEISSGMTFSADSVMDAIKGSQQDHHWKSTHQSSTSSRQAPFSCY